jgi:hypothetical protein
MALSAQAQRRVASAVFLLSAAMLLGSVPLGLWLFPDDPFDTGWTVMFWRCRWWAS